MKECSRCRRIRPLGDFREAPKKDGRHPYCRECERTYQAAYRAAHASKRAEWFASNKESQREKVRKWAKENAGKRNAANALRYATKKKATPPWANQEAMRLMYEQARRLSEQTGVQYEVDHIVPMQGATVCGLHCEANLRVITGTENAGKSNRYWPGMPE